MDSSGAPARSCGPLDPSCIRSAGNTADGGDGAATYERLRGAGYLLSHCDMTQLYFAQDRHTGQPRDFIQGEIEVLHPEHAGRRLFDGPPFRTPPTLQDLEPRDVAHPVLEVRIGRGFETFLSIRRQREGTPDAGDGGVARTGPNREQARRPVRRAVGVRQVDGRADARRACAAVRPAKEPRVRALDGLRRRQARGPAVPPTLRSGAGAAW